MSYCAKILCLSTQESMDNGFCLSLLFINSQNSNEPTMLWSTWQVVILSCCKDLTGIQKLGASLSAWALVWLLYREKGWRGNSNCRAPVSAWHGPLEGSSASPCEWEMDQKPPESPSVTEPESSSVSSQMKYPEGNMLLLWVGYGVFFLVMLIYRWSARMTLVCTTSGWEGN